MNAPAPHIQFQQACAANIARMAKAAAEWAERPNDEYAELAFLDAATFCVDGDPHLIKKDLMFDLRMDEEGYPLTSEGDRAPNGIRRYVPLTSQVAA